MSILDQIVKAYDIRGTVPDQLDADIARAIGVAFATLRPERRGSSSAGTCGRPAWSWWRPSPTG